MLGTLCALSATSRTVGGQEHSDVANLVIQGLDAQCIMAEMIKDIWATARATIAVNIHGLRTYVRGLACELGRGWSTQSKVRLQASDLG